MSKFKVTRWDNRKGKVFQLIFKSDWDAQFYLTHEAHNEIVALIQKAFEFPVQVKIEKQYHPNTGYYIQIIQGFAKPSLFPSDDAALDHVKPLEEKIQAIITKNDNQKMAEALLENKAETLRHQTQALGEVIAKKLMEDADKITNFKARLAGLQAEMTATMAALIPQLLKDLEETIQADPSKGWDPEVIKILASRDPEFFVRLPTNNPWFRDFSVKVEEIKEIISEK